MFNLRTLKYDADNNKKWKTQVITTNDSIKDIQQSYIWIYKRAEIEGTLWCILKKSWAAGERWHRCNVMLLSTSAFRCR